MKLLELHIDGFGKIHDCTLSFQDGINVIYGPNEAGKSTLHTFIRGMLFGIERGRGRAAKGDLYSRYEPWENSGTYEGWLKLESGGFVYRIERRFRRDSKSLKIVNETLGREEEPTRVLWDTLLGGLNETTYNNTISIGQLKSATEEGMVGELKNYIANMNSTGNLALNITKATAFLRSQKRALEADLVPDASREYTALLGEIRSLDAEISSPEYENQLSAYQNMRGQVKDVLANTRAEKDSLNEKVQSARQILSENGFSDREAIEECRKKCADLYADIQETDALCAKKSRGVLTVFSFLMTALGAAAAGALGVMDLSAFLLPVCGSAAAALLFLTAGLLLIRQGKRYQDSLDDLIAELETLLKKYLDTDTVSDSSVKAFGARMDEFSGLCDVLARSEEQLQKYMEEISSLQQKQNSCSEMIEKQQRIQWELEKKLEALNNCKTRAKALQRILAENDRIREEAAAIELAQETMTNLSSSIRDSFGLYLNKEASRLIAGITGGIYDSMSIDENLNVFLNTKTKLVPIESVSSGAMDQVYLALRLAAANLLNNGSGTLPLIFDDSFTQYDDDRLKTALKWLSSAYDGQMLIFTCHHRESQLMRANQIPFHLIEIGR